MARAKSKIFLIIILILGFFLRIYKMSSVPLYGDELTMVYDSYSILKTAHDQLGNFLPLTFPMGAGRPAGYVYFSVPFVAIFGPTAFGVRSLSLLSGIGIIFLMYLLGKRLFNEKIGLIASFLTSVSFWDISLSRAGFEAHFALFLALLGIVSFLHTNKKPLFYLIFSLSWALAIHTYPVYKLVLFLFMPFLIFYQWGGIKKHLREKKSFLLILASFLIGFLAIFLSLKETFRGISEERFFSLNVFSRQDIRENIVSNVIWERNLMRLPEEFELLVSNKFAGYIILLVSSYLKNFSTDFLFISGDGNPRHNMFEFGQMFYIDFILILFGLISLGIMLNKKENIKTFLLIVLWLLIAPFGSFLLLQEHALRNGFMLPPLILLSSLGYFLIWEKRRIFWANLSLFVLIIAGFLQFILALFRLYFLLPYKNSNFWSTQAKEVFLLTEDLRRKYDYIFLSKRIDDIEYAYEVYGKVDPLVVQKQNRENPKMDGFWVRNFDNVYIIDVPKEYISTFLSNRSGNYIFIGDHDYFKESLSDYKVIDFRMGTNPVLIKESLKK